MIRNYYNTIKKKKECLYTYIGYYKILTPALATATMANRTICNEREFYFSITISTSIN